MGKPASGKSARLAYPSLLSFLGDIKLNVTQANDRSQYLEREKLAHGTQSRTQTRTAAFARSLKCITNDIRLKNTHQLRSTR
jgi:hypothetical protein